VKCAWLNIATGGPDGSANATTDTGIVGVGMKNDPLRVPASFSQCGRSRQERSFREAPSVDRRRRHGCWKKSGTGRLCRVRTTRWLDEDPAPPFCQHTRVPADIVVVRGNVKRDMEN
jgi:hypothetical protein